MFMCCHGQPVPPQKQQLRHWPQALNYETLLSSVSFACDVVNYI